MNRDYKPLNCLAMLKYAFEKKYGNDADHILGEKLVEARKDIENWEREDNEEAMFYEGSYINPPLDYPQEELGNG